MIDLIYSLLLSILFIVIIFSLYKFNYNLFNIILVILLLIPILSIIVFISSCIVFPVLVNTREGEIAVFKDNKLTRWLFNIYLDKKDYWAHENI